MMQPALPPRRPGSALAPRALPMFWLIDGSGSMRIDARMTALQHALREAQPSLRALARTYPQVEINVRALRFAQHAEWLDETSLPIESYAWNELQGQGLTALGDGLQLLEKALPEFELGRPAWPPIIILVTDGLPTDEVAEPLRRLSTHPWAARALKLVISMGDEVAEPEGPEFFQAFIGREKIRPIHVSRLEDLASVVLRVSAGAIRTVCDPGAPDFGDWSWESEGLFR